jgi:hypothetical protein
MTMQILQDLINWSWRYPQTAKSVCENINEEYGRVRDDNLMHWTEEMWRSAHSQFYGLIDSKEAR